MAGDGDPWMDTGNDVVDFGLFNQDGGGHGGAIRGPGQFDGQAIHSDGGWGEVTFGSVGTNGDEGGEMVADIGTDAQVNDRYLFICVVYFLVRVLATSHDSHQYACHNF